MSKHAYFAPRVEIVLLMRTLEVVISDMGVMTSHGG